MEILTAHRVGQRGRIIRLGEFLFIELVFALLSGFVVFVANLQHTPMHVNVLCLLSAKFLVWEFA